MKLLSKIFILTCCISQHLFTSYEKLVEVALAQDKSALENLIDQGADINMKDKNGNSPLFHILLQEPSIQNLKIEHRSFDLHENMKIIYALELLIDYGADYMTINHNDEQFLLYLVSKDNIIHNTIFDYLLKHKLTEKDLAITDSYGNTLLMTAAIYNNPYVVKQLHNYYNTTYHDNHAYFEPYNDYGYSALGLARRYNHRNISGYLARYGAKKENDLSQASIEPLFIAAYDNNTSWIKEELQKGVSINTKNKNGDTALLIATREGHLNTVKYLLKKGANPNIANHLKETPLLISMHLEPGRKNLELVESLMEYKASIQAQDNKGRTACMLANQNYLMQNLMNKYCTPHQTFSHTTEV